MIKYIIIYLIVVNLASFLLMYIDKKKSQVGDWRISENTFLVLTVIGGGIGVQAAMYIFRHKTQKLKFVLLMPIIIALEIAFMIYLYINNIVI